LRRRERWNIGLHLPISGAMPRDDRADDGGTTMRTRVLALLSVPALALAGLAAPGLAQDTDRYALEKSAEGYIRMDRRTGAMSICTERDGQLVCRLAADDRDAFESEIERLSDAVDDLSDRVAALEQKSSGATSLPSESEFEQGLSYMEQFFRRFMGVVEEFDRNFRSEPEKPDPQRT
jgi:hypothetical protein